MKKSLSIFLAFLVLFTLLQPASAALVNANDMTVRRTAATAAGPSIKLSKNTLTMIKGKTYTLKSTVKGASSKVKWTSTDKKIATVTSGGTVKAVKPGKVTITASANGVKAKCVVTVKDAIIQLGKSSLSIEVGKKYTLKATVKGASSKVSWASSKSSIATVNSNGVITAKKVGTTVITAKANGKTSKCTVTVKKVSAKTRALAAYRNLLSKSTVSVIPKGTQIIGSWPVEKYKSTKTQNVTFSIAYIDNDNTPELILADTSRYIYGVWTFKNGKVVPLLYEDFSGKPIGYYKKKGIFRGDSYTEGTIFYQEWYKISGGTSKRVLHTMIYDSYGGESRYYVGNTTSSKSAFNKKLNSYVGNVKLTKLSMHKNTEANRKQYLK